MQFLAVFDFQCGFYGQIYQIPDVQALYQIVYDRTYLLGLMEDADGSLRPVSSFDYDELMCIYKSAVHASEVHLVDSIEQLKSLSDNSLYKRRLFEPFLDCHR